MADAHSGKHQNRLADETSPYLLQHAHNPVDWYPWSAEAFETARRQGKPILLSVGYSACHWCHVMAHESFEDAATAELMNRHFVNIKVDREERPDVDAVYMNAVQAMTGAGGWPMTVALTPEGAPFYGGTYFPPDDRYGRPSFKRVLLGLADAWQNRRDEVQASAGELTEHLGRLVNLSAEGDLSSSVADNALNALAAQFDARHGGFGGAPKFPPHSVLRFLLRRPEASARKMAELTLEHMARGGLYDQLGGGFARYSVDELWLVPHFEKMLYDNAQLVRRYLEAYQVSGKPLYRRVAEETLAWVGREMTDRSGGFYSALDADSEREEGKFYVWDESEFDTLLAEDARLAKAAFGVTSAGNFEGKNILHLPHDSGALAERFGLSAAELEAKLDQIKTTLLKAREARVRPGRDDKVLCSWNGLMLAAFADAGRILGRRDYLDTATENARFIEREMYQDDRLFHSFKDGHAKIAGLLEDYAFFGLGLLALYRADFEGHWLLLALDLAEVIKDQFYDPKGGGFFSTAGDAERLIVRPKDFFDSAVPSDNGATAEFLLTLARYTGNHSWEEMAASAIRPVAQALEKQPSGFGSLLCALAQLLSPPREIALFGEKAADDTATLLEVINRQPLPYTAVALVEDKDNPLIKRLPFLQGRDRQGGKATAYVCQGGACKLPATTASDLEGQLEATRPG